MLHMVTVVILTFNEEKHIKRCIDSVTSFANQIIVVDSFSSDSTLSIAKKLGAEVFQNPFINQAVQFQWALDHIEIKGDWILRLDADEIITEKLSNEIKGRLTSIDANVNGIYLKRQVHFMGQWIKYGGYYPIKLLRLWRKGTASVEQKWMDEHVILKYGETIEFEHDFIDDNLNNLSWWTLKHDNYSNREVIEYLNQKHKIFTIDSINSTTRTQEAQKRRYKSKYYNRAPLFLRAMFYFIFRYFIKLGFLDGVRGIIWHFLQGFWYRFLVDSKIYQIERLSKSRNESIETTIEKEFKIKLTK